MSRVTLAEIEAEIVEEFYANGAGAFSNNYLTNEHYSALNQVTLCVLILRNGCKVIGVNYGAIDPADFDEALGRAAAREEAIDQCWPLLGFRRRDQIAATAGSASASDPKVIKPSVGRKVWFYPGGGMWPAGMQVFPASDYDAGRPQPLDATIVYVHTDRLVSLRVIDHAGHAFPVRSVQLVQPGDEACGTGHRAEWMPYQVGQAKKAGDA
ncbi:TPA: Gp49 family protein [Stenotrophomonas maltophilia]